MEGTLPTPRQSPETRAPGFPQGREREASQASESSQRAAVPATPYQDSGDDLHVNLKPDLRLPGRRWARFSQLPCCCTGSPASVWLAVLVPSDLAQLYLSGQ